MPIVPIKTIPLNPPNAPKAPKAKSKSKACEYFDDLIRWTSQTTQSQFFQRHIVHTATR